jgi:uncharacterized protein
MSKTDEQQKIEQSVIGALEALTRNDVTLWPALFDTDGSQEFPYAPEGSPKVIKGKDKIADYLSNYPETFELTRIVEPKFHHDGATAILEFSVEGSARRTGKPYNQRYISVIEHSSGKISRYVDYWNPLVVQEALGQMFR